MRRFLSILTLLASLSFGEDVAVLQTFDEPYVLNGSSFAQPDEFTKAPYEDGDYVRFVWASSSSTVDGTIVGVIGGGEYALLTVLGGFVTPTDGLLQWLDGQNDGTNTLSDKTSPAYDVELAQSHAYYHDGSGYELVQSNTYDLAETGFILSGGFRFESLPDTSTIIGQDTKTASGSIILLCTTSGTLLTQFAGANVILASSVVSTGVDYTFSYQFDPDAEEVTLTLNGTEYTGSVVPTRVADGNILWGIDLAGTQPADIAMWNLELRSLPSRTLDVILFTGQSNCSGILEDDPVGLDTSRHLYVADVIGFATNFNTGTTLQSLDGQWGMELSIGDGIARTSAVVKVAHNGQPILSWDDASSTLLFQRTRTAIDNIVSNANVNGYMARASAFVWNQGEGDASYGAYTNGWTTNYANNFSTMWEELKRDTFFEDDTHVIISQINQNINTNFLYAYEIANQQADIVASLPNATLVDNDDLALRDTVHYTSNALITAGERIAAAYNANTKTYPELFTSIPCAEGGGDDLHDVTTYRNDPVLSGTYTNDVIWSKRQDSYHYNMVNGFSPLFRFGGSGDYATAPSNFLDGVSKWAIELTLTNEVETTVPIIGLSTASRPGIWRGVNEIKWRTSGGDVALTVPSMNGTTLIYSDETDIYVYQDGELVDSGTAVGGTTATLDRFCSYNAGFYYTCDMTRARVWDLTDMGTVSYANIIAATPDHDYYSANSVSNSFVDNVGGNDAVPTGTEFVKYPALQAGDDAFGLGVLNSPIGAGIMHNNAETLLVQTNLSELTHSGLWYTSGVPVQVSYDDGRSWVSGNSNTWVNFETSDGVCLWTDNLIYEQTKSYTPTEIDALNGLYPNTCGGGLLVPYIVVSGGIGNGTYYSPDGTNVYLVVEE